MMIHSLAEIHPTAIINDGATVCENVYVGPYCVIGSNVTLKAGVRLISHVCVDGITVIGEDSIVYPFASIGHSPQDLKYKGEPSTVTIGEKTTIREYVTIQPGTEGGGMKTVVGDHCLLMVGVHIAHDCHVGNHVIMANYATLAGHVVIADHVIVGGLSAIQQFVRVGVHAIIGGMSGVEKDVVPYAMVMGERAHLHGVNLVGMRRHGFSNAVIQKVQSIYKDLFNEDDHSVFAERVAKQHNSDAENESEPATQTLFDFMNVDSKRHYCMPKGRG